MNFQRSFATPFLLAFVALLLISGGAYLYTQMKSGNQLTITKLPIQMASTTQAADAQTANWKTYTNVQYGFEIQYPQDWSLEKDPHYDSEGKTISGESDFYLTSVDLHRIIIAPFGIEYPTNVQDNTLSGWKINVPTSTYSAFSLGIVPVNAREEIDPQQLPLLHRIISTFKLINIDTSTWKTYQNKKYGIEFSYPDHWVIKDTTPEASYANWELMIYPVDPDKYCTELQAKSSKGFLCGVGLGLQIYQDHTTKRIIFNKDAGIENGLMVQEPELDHIISTFKFTR